jgi:hypothetical protein
MLVKLPMRAHAAPAAEDTIQQDRRQWFLVEEEGTSGEGDGLPFVVEGGVDEVEVEAAVGGVAGEPGGAAPEEEGVVAAGKVVLVGKQPCGG